MRIGITLKAKTGGTLPPRKSEPITFGVPFPKGACHESDAWQLGDGQSAVQTRVLDRWVDDSVRWLLVDAQVTTGSGVPDTIFLEKRGTSAASSTLKIYDQGGVVTVDTGAAQFVIGAGDAFPFREVRTKDGLFSGPRCGTLTVTGADGRIHEAVISSVTIEEKGPCRAVVRYEGEVALERRTLVVTARVHFFLTQPVVRLLVTLRNTSRAVHKGGFWDLGDPGSILIKDAAVSFQLSRSATQADVSCELNQGARPFSIPLEVYQDSSGGENWKSTNHINRDRIVPTSFRGYCVRSTGQDESGLRATPIVSAGGVGIAVPAFWENFPQAIDVTENSISWRFFPGQFADLHEMQGGEQKTSEAYFSFGADSVSAQPLEWCRNRLVACVDPEWIINSGAVPFLAPFNSQHEALVRSAVDGPDRFTAKREIIDEYGWRHFGDLYGDHESTRQKDPPIVSHYNNQYDAALGFLFQFMRQSDPRWWRLAEDLVRHVIDIDIYHTQEDKSAFNGGLFWHTFHYGDADTATHRSYPANAKGRIHGGGPSADHNYTTGLVYYYFLTGDEDAKAAAIGLAQYVINLDDGRLTVFRYLDRGSTGRAINSAPGYFGPGRGPANSLVTLLDGYRLTRDRRFLRKADEVVRLVVNPKDDFVKLDLKNTEQRWFYTMFLQSLGKYLAFKVEFGERDEAYEYAAASLLSYARWMTQHAHMSLDKPELVVYPTETWPAQDIRKSDAFCFAALIAQPNERAIFLERADYFHRESLAAVERFPTRIFLRPVVILLTSGYMKEWMDRSPEAGWGAADSTRPFPPPAAFVPQRTRAIKRFKVLAVCAAAATFAGAAAAAYYFFL